MAAGTCSTHSNPYLVDIVKRFKIRRGFSIPQSQSTTVCVDDMEDVAAEIIQQIGTSVEHKGNSDTLPAAWQLMTVFRDDHKYLP